MEPLSYQSLSCQNCDASKDAHCSLAYLGFTKNIDCLRKNGDSAVLPVQVIVDQFIKHTAQHHSNLTKHALPVVLHGVLPCCTSQSNHGYGSSRHQTHKPFTHLSNLAALSQPQDQHTLWWQSSTMRCFTLQPAFVKGVICGGTMMARRRGVYQLWQPLRILSISVYCQRYPAFLIYC